MFKKLAGLWSRSGPAVTPPHTVLLADCNFPRPLHDAGSVETVALIGSLRGLGFQVAFLALGEFFLSPDQRDPEARAALERQGVLCLSPSPDQGATGDLGIADACASLPSVSVCILARVCCGGAFAETLRATFPKARFLFLPHDLHFLREEREALLQGDGEALAAARQTREQERHLLETCDATLMVSRYEIDVARQLVPGALCVHLPLTRHVTARAMSAGRRDIGFIGNFGHRPNGDAVRHFLDVLWPSIMAHSPDTRFHVIGDGAPDWLRALQSETVMIHGHVPDLDALLKRLRLTVAPLRFGAGAKGKVISSLAQGVPCVMSAIAAEGMDFPVGVTDTCCATDDARFIRMTLSLLQDDALWQHVSDAATRMVEDMHGPDVMKRQLATLLDGFSLLP
ncbi:glycosyltransferase family 4 protein [Brytella acorum]|uniref:Glycosyltransferase family 4 protein n=1 Tax=Brytella acorum TaxID=2959299 RepID=A0AA35UWY2_9PROT|nr:glycosyltransferase family 4 protein [Brytella acorum]MDF3625120.1 glycosyltransferase family 4 protein [Brytella acorum]CAI9121001.1 glycosyltransferase family 4 protein [Brytella acorum]